MKLTHIIEYYKVDGKVTIDYPNTDALIHEVSVEFEAEPQWENSGIGDYEFWGSKEVDYGQDYVSLEQNGNPTWNRDKHTKDENEAIHLFTESPDFENLCDKFCKIYAKENK